MNNRNHPRDDRPLGERVVGAIATVAARAGAFARGARETLETARANAGPAIQRAQELRDVVLDPDRRTALQTGLRRRLQVVAGVVNSGVPGAVAVFRESLKGMPTDLASTLYVLTSLEVRALNAHLEGLAEVAAARQKFEQIRTTLEADPRSDVATLHEEFDALIAAANTAFDNFPTTEDQVRRQHVEASSGLSYIQDIVRQCDEAEATCVASIYNFTPLARIEDGDEALLWQLGQVPGPIDASNMQLSAVLLHNWNVAASHFRQAEEQALAAYRELLERKESIEGLFMTQLTEAELKGVKNDPELMRIAQEFHELIRASLCDLDAAEPKCQEYIVRLSQLP